MKKAPDFCLQDQNGESHCLKDYKGQWLLLYFYPKDNTPGCTKEACAIRDTWDYFSNRNATVVGISADSEESHKKFQDKYKLPFTLLSDEDREVIRAYGVEKDKSMFGKTFLGISRESFLINPEGEIVKHYEKVQPDKHALEVLKDLQEYSK